MLALSSDWAILALKFRGARNKMITKIKCGWLACYVASMLAMEGAVSFRNLVQLESKYVGNGVFQYTLTFPDTYLERVNFNDVDSLIVPFVGFTEFGNVSTNWAGGGVTALPPVVKWDHNRSADENVPYQSVFQVRSTERTFRRSLPTESAFVGLKIKPYVWAPGGGGDWVAGSARLGCLVPCPPDAADGSGPTYLTGVVEYPELRITSFVISNDVPVGLNFSAGQAIVDIQTGSNLTNWTKVAEVTSTGESGSWLAPGPLFDLGQFFRLRVGPQVASVPPAASGLIASSLSASTGRNSSDVPVLGIRPVGDAIEVQIKTESGEVYRVALGGLDGQPTQARTVTASSSVTRVQFRDQALPNPFFVRVRLSSF